MGKRMYKFQPRIEASNSYKLANPCQPRRPPPQRQPPPSRPASPPILQKDLPSDVVNAMWLKMDITSLLKSKTVCKSWEGLISNGLSSNEYLSLSLSLSIKNIPESDDDLSWLLELGTIKNVEWIEIDYHKLNDPVTLLEIDEVTLLKILSEPV
ncbi:F-box associated domain containing protein [Tanacetum coccineum]